MVKKLFVIGILSACIFGVFTQKTFAYSGPGDGTQESPYLINNCVQLGEMNNDKAAHYALFTDIDCSQSKNWAEAINGGYKGFYPVGSADQPFTGSLDGRGHTISALYIDRVDDVSGEGPDDESNVGLFGFTNGATIESLKLANTRVRGYRYVAMLS